MRNLLECERHGILLLLSAVKNIASHHKLSVCIRSHLLKCNIIFNYQHCCHLLQATDADGVQQGGGQVFYAIQDGNTEDGAFFIEPVSGEVTVTRPLTYLDTPTSSYTLTVRASDAGE